MHSRHKNCSESLEGMIPSVLHYGMDHHAQQLPHIFPLVP